MYRLNSTSLHEFTIFQAFRSEPPLPGLQISPALAALMVVAPFGPSHEEISHTKGKKQSLEEMLTEASEGRQDDEDDASPLSGGGNGNGKGSDAHVGDDDEVDKEVEDVEEEKGGDDDEEAAVEMLCQPLKRLHRGVWEEIPAHCKPRGGSVKSHGLQIPLITPTPVRRRHMPSVVP